MTIIYWDLKRCVTLVCKVEYYRLIGLALLQSQDKALNLPRTKRSKRQTESGMGSGIVAMHKMLNDIIMYPWHNIK